MYLLNRKILFLTSLLFCGFNLAAQDENNIKLIVETGILPLGEDSENLGLFLNVEPKIKVLDNTYFGIRFGLTLNSHAITNNDNFQFYIDDQSDHAVLSFVPTFDYYIDVFKFRSYVGVGLGAYLLPYQIDVFRSSIANPTEELLEGEVNRRIGVLLRGGLEFRKLRLGLEYNFLPKADIKILNDQIIGAVENSYLGVSIGFLIVGGKKSI